MKATFEYDLAEPYEKKQAHQHLKADDLSIALWDISQLFRNALKYENVIHEGYLTDEEFVVVEKLQENIIDIIEEYDLKFVLEG